MHLSNAAHPPKCEPSIADQLHQTHPHIHMVANRGLAVCVRGGTPYSLSQLGRLRQQTLASPIKLSNCAKLVQTALQYQLL